MLRPFAWSLTVYKSNSQMTSSGLICLIASRTPLCSRMHETRYTCIAIAVLGLVSGFLPDFLKVVLWSKNHFLFFFRFWKCVSWTPVWKNFKLWFDFYPKAVYFECKFWISRSAITHVQNWPTGPQRFGSRKKWRHSLNSLKFQPVNAVYYVCKTRV